MSERTTSGDGVFELSRGLQGSVPVAPDSKIIRWAESNLKSLRAVYVPGRENWAAHNLSRVFPLIGASSSRRDIFQQLQRRYGCPRVDLFASRDKFFCVSAGLFLAWRTDALLFRWPGDLLYAFPPISIIARVLHKIREDQAWVLSFLAGWVRCPWYPLSMNLAIQPHLEIPGLP